MAEQLTITAGEVHAVLGKHLLTDGFKLVLDTDASQGSWLVDARDGKRYLDMYTFFASAPLGCNPPGLVDDLVFMDLLGRVAANKPDIAWVVSVPGDCPFLPRDLVACLHDARVAKNKPLACAHSGDWRHPVVGLWPVALRENLRRAVTVEDLRKIEVWTARHGVALADWPVEPVDPFFNVNTPEDVAKATELASSLL